MTQTYGPFFSGTGANFSETQWREFFGNLIVPGVIKGASALGATPGNLAVTAPGGSMNVSIATGVAWVYGFLYENDAALTQAIAASDPSADRTDYVTVRLDFVARTVLAHVVQGTNGAGIPALTQSITVWDVPLATVAVPHGLATIATGNITDARAYASLNTTLSPAFQGAGNGLNADQVDGIHASSFALGAGLSQHIIVLNRAPTNADGVDGDLIFQW